MEFVHSINQLRGHSEIVQNHLQLLLDVKELEEVTGFQKACGT